MGFLASLLSALALGLLKALWARHDLAESVRKDIALATADLNQKALAWLATADPATAARLRVRDGAEPLTLAPPPADPPGGTHPLPVPPGKSDG